MLATAQLDLAPVAAECVPAAAPDVGDPAGILAAAGARAASENLPYAGAIPPHDAWALAEGTPADGTGPLPFGPVNLPEGRPYTRGPDGHQAADPTYRRP